MESIFKGFLSGTNSIVQMNLKRVSISTRLAVDNEPIVTKSNFLNQNVFCSQRKSIFKFLLFVGF